jgi:hypothetical protein
MLSLRSVSPFGRNRVNPKATPRAPSRSSFFKTPKYLLQAERGRSGRGESAFAAVRPSSLVFRITTKASRMGGLRILTPFSSIPM